MGWRSRLRRSLARERLTIWALGVVVIVAALLVGFAGTPYMAPDGSIERVSAIPGATVTETAGGYAITPSTEKPDTGLVFYPGARVDPNAYVSMLAPVVDQTGVAVFVPRPRLNLAVFEPGMADSIASDHPSIDRWYVGGHSLGGAMACRYAAANSEAVTGLVLFGSYCDRSIADTDLSVLSVGGTSDTVLGTETGALRPETLPESATIRRVEGLNHTQFGSYTGQPGDSPAEISRARAHDRLQSLLIEFFETE
ncbi:alpha/beta hydrolase [Halodesulfurarchaeum sp.]|uniref:alpha/beta hydrolase n=1 Tax=Halodesulfurarchaeum sp. TaxID=1980530 RepID=UPI002FC3C519